MAAEGIELATVYVSLVPSLRGAPEAISDAVGKATRSPVVRRSNRELGDQIVGDIAAAIKKAAAIPGAVASATKSAAQKAQASFKTLTDNVRTFGLLGTTVAQGMISIWGGVLPEMFPKTAARLTELGKSFRSVGELGGQAAAYVKGRWSEVTAPATRAISAVSARVSDMVGGVSKAMSTVGAAVGDRLAVPLARVSLTAQAASRTAQTAFGRAFDTVGRSLESRLGAPFRNAMGAVRNGISETSQLFNAVSQTFGRPFMGLSKAASSAMSGLSGAVRSGLGAAHNVASSMASGIGNAISSGIGFGVKAAGAAVAGLAGVIGANLGSAVERADMLNNFPKVMANIGYSSSEAEAEIKRISNSLDGLPTSTQAVVQTVKGLAPLTGGLSQATDVALALNNALLASGSGADLAANAMEQYRQMLSVGKVDMAAWRSLTQAMPGQLDMIAASLLGASAKSEDLRQAMMDGRVSFDDFNNALVSLNKEGINGIASFEEQAKTATGGIGSAFTNVKNRITKAIETILSALGVENIATKINEFSSGITGYGEKIAGVIEGMKSGGAGVDEFGSKLGGLLPILGGVGGLAGGALGGLPVIGGLFSGLTGPVGLAIGAFAGMYTESDKLQGAIGGLGETLGSAFTSDALQSSLGSIMGSFGSMLGTMGDALAPLVNMLGNLVAQALPPLMAAFDGLMAFIEPIVNGLFGGLGNALEKIEPPFNNFVNSIMPMLTDGFNQIKPLLAEVGEKIGGFLSDALSKVGEVIAAILPTVQNFFEVAIPIAVTVLRTIISVIGDVIDIIVAVLTPVINAIAAVFTWAFNAIGTIVTWLWANVMEPIVGFIMGAWQGLSDWFSTTFVNFISTAVDTVKGIFQSIADKASDIKNGVTSAFESMKDTISSIWESVKGIVARPVNFVIKTVYTDGLKKLVEGVADAVGLDISLPSINGIEGYASGGVLPGYTPGRDVYHFYSPDGGGALALSGGEAIMRPEWVRAVGGAPAVHAMNAAARRGGAHIPGGDLGRAAAFADGGIWNAAKNFVGRSASKAWDFIKETADIAASVITDPLGAVENLIRVPVNALMDGFAGKGFFGDALRAIPGKLVDGVGGFFKKKTEGMAPAGGEGIVGAARTAIGVPYVWGGSSIPPGLDCSGLVYWAANQVGYKIPRLTAAGYQANAGGPANINVPGNLLFWGSPAWHVAITSGNGMMVEAPKPGMTVRETAIWGSPEVRTYKFDSGGWLQPGYTSVVNKTGKPEAILTSGQWSLMDDLIKGMADNTPSELVVRDMDNKLIGRMRVEAEDRIVAYSHL